MLRVRRTPYPQLSLLKETLNGNLDLGSISIAIAQPVFLLGDAKDAGVMMDPPACRQALLPRQNKVEIVQALFEAASRPMLVCTAVP
jgi:hypothetical protein